MADITTEATTTWLPVDTQAATTHSVAIQSTDMPTVNTGPSFMPYITPIILVALTVAVCYLAYMGSAEAQATVLSTFALLAGQHVGARTALKQPGVDK